jgi:type IV pilus assembly protein PilW
MIDNGRYALELLSGNLRLAGFYDNYAPIGPSTTFYDPCNTAAITDSSKNLDILNLSVQGYNAATATSLVTIPPFANPSLTNLPCSLTYTAGSNLTLKAGSDILVVRRASTVIAASAASGTTYLQVSMCQTDTAAPPNNYQIVTAPAVAPASFSSMHKKDCATAADLRPFMVLTYFVSPNNNVANGGDGIPTLKQIDQYGTVTPLVEGIEYMQVDYGVDDNGDGATDRYTDCSACTLADWSNVVAVRINIVARNQDKTTGWSDSKTYALGLAGTVGPFNDNYKRHAYTQLVRLVNPAGRRETP